MLAAAALFLAAQLARPESLVVNSAAGRRAVEIVSTPDGPALPAAALAGALGGRLRSLNGSRYRLTAGGTDFDVADQLPYLRVGVEVVPLAVAPFVANGRLLVPYQLAAEQLPRFATGWIYDASLGELRIFGGQVRRATDTPRVAASAPVAASPAAAPGGSGPLRRHLVVVDAGHGGPDNGMTGPIGGPGKIYEKNITLSVANLVAARLRDSGVDVLMTRTTDTLIALGDRGRIANQKKGDLFVSVHVNAANPNWREPAKARGYETYFLAEAKTEEESRVERMENESVRFETGANAPKGDPLSFIINDMAQNEHLRESNDLAQTIQQRLGQTHPGPSRGVKQANFAVLRTSFMPAVLVEIGFGTNPAEADYIADPSRQREIATAIADATVGYLRRYDRRVRAPR